MVNTNKKWASMSDRGIIAELGNFIRYHRLNKNLTQQQLATNAGVNRWTLGQIEKGEPVTMLSFIQILRALDLLNVLETFNVEPQISPIELAKLEQKRRKRASGKNSMTDLKSDW